MSKKVEFHGSDLEKIAEYYHIPKEAIVMFGANVNPLGLSDAEIGRASCRERV